jgi:steroid delta-isomerase-like uncharacterized protein
MSRATGSSDSFGGQTNPRQVVERLVELFRTNDAELAAEIYAEDVVIDDPMYGEQVAGREAARGAFGDWFRAFRILEFEVVDSIVEGSRIAVHWRWRAVHQGEYLGVPPSGAEFAGWHLMFFDTHDGRISRDLTCWDCTQFFELRRLAEQAGAV